MSDLNEIREIDTAVQDLFERIPAMTEAQLITTAAYAEKLGRKAYLVRGACVSHLLDDGPTRLRGGRGKRDLSREGKRARTEDIAAHLGAHRRTLEIDARIYKTFFAAEDNSQTCGVRAAPLPRELYVLALAAPDPKAAIKEAVKHASDPSYGRKQFRAYVHELRRACPKRQPTGRATNLLAVKIRLPADVGRALAELETWAGGSTDQLVAEAVLRLHKLYRHRRTGTDRVRASTSTASVNAAPAQEQLLF